MNRAAAGDPPPPLQPPDLSVQPQGGPLAGLQWRLSRERGRETPLTAMEPLLTMALPHHANPQDGGHWGGILVSSA